MRASSVAVVLAGGQGSRIRHLLPAVPKALAPVAGRPFLEWVLRFLRAQGIGRVIVSTGYLAEQVDAFAATAAITGLTVQCVRESKPLGTAGALRHTLPHLAASDDELMVCNGDTLVLTPLAQLWAALRAAAVGAALLGVRVPDASRYGSIRISPDNTLAGFCEKQPGAGLVNAGVYVLRRGELAHLHLGTPASLELDVFPALLKRGTRIAVLPCEGPFIDIGTEASLRQADAFVQLNRGWFA